MTTDQLEILVVMEKVKRVVKVRDLLLKVNLEAVA